MVPPVAIRIATCADQLLEVVVTVRPMMATKKPGKLNLAALLDARLQSRERTVKLTSSVF